MIFQKKDYIMKYIFLMQEESHQKNGKQLLDIPSRKELDMNEKIGEVFSITKDNQPIPGCTTSKAVNDTLSYFSLA